MQTTLILTENSTDLTERQYVSYVDTISLVIGKKSESEIHHWKKMLGMRCRANTPKTIRLDTVEHAAYMHHAA
jgi:hypothetical protein